MEYPFHLTPGSTEANGCSEASGLTTLRSEKPSARTGWYFRQRLDDMAESEVLTHFLLTCLRLLFTVAVVSPYITQRSRARRYVVLINTPLLPKDEHWEEVPVIIETNKLTDTIGNCQHEILSLLLRVAKVGSIFHFRLGCFSVGVIATATAFSS
jgi:hypothetical protein